MDKLKALKITSIKGVGPNLENRLLNNDIFNVADILFRFPSRYENYEITEFSKAFHGEKVTIEGTIVSSPVIAYIRSNLNKITFSLNTNDNIVLVTIFNRKFLFRNLTVGTVVILSGKIDKYKNTMSVSNLFFKKNMSKNIVPKYNLKEIKDGTFNNIVKEAFNSNKKYLIEYIPEQLLKKYDYVDIETAIELVHMPKTGDDISKSIRRLKYEELLKYQLKLQYMKYSLRTYKDSYRIDYDINIVKSFIQTLPFTLTADQQNVTNEIFKDLKQNYRMNRLLQGDVGSGKTVVAALAIIANYTAKGQSVIMAPTEVLAKQHYDNFKKMFGNMMNIAFLASSVSKDERLVILNQLKNGDIDFIIGTHALYQKDVLYHNLTLSIIDEQHRFGVNQRKLLNEKSGSVNRLFLSATPIPRTLALAMYGDMDVSTIEELPAGRQIIKTTHYKYDKLEKVFVKIMNHLKKNNQIYVISPMIDDIEKEQNSVLKLMEEYRELFPKDIQIEYLHSKRTNEEKETIMSLFSEGKIDILISTTVIEVGIDNPNATLMVIYDADRFGLSQLHQLRGRVGRGEKQSECILISNIKTDLSKKRIEIIKNEHNGFVLSEEDMKLRGPGDFFGLKQSGMPTFATANIIDDYPILIMARNDAKDLMQKNGLDTKQYYQLKQTILQEISNDNISL